MMATLLDQIRAGLMEKRDILVEWLRTVPPDKRQILLGPATEQAVRAHVDVLDGSIARAEAGTLGECEVCHGQIEPELLEVDYTSCVCLGDLSEEQVRDLEAELALAQSVQRTLLPQEVPGVPGLDIAAFSRPAQIVGGDYFDFVELKGGQNGLIIADVAGHGVSASLHMASIQAMLRAVAPTVNSPAEVVRKVQELFIHNIRFITFVTLFISSIDPARRTLSYCNAGHNPPALLRESENGDPIWLRPTGPAIGLVEEAEFGEGEAELRSGDLLVMYTDGVTEAVNPQDEEFGQQRLTELLERVYHSPSVEVVREIREELESFCQGRPLADDTTFVVCRIT